MRIVVALGGNALLRRGEPPEARLQHEHVVEAAQVLGRLAVGHELIVTHGNGPQVGLLALESESCQDVAPFPLDVLGAESQGMIGYLLQNALSNVMPSRIVATVLTRVEVEAADPAFLAPTKPIGRIYEEAEARRLSAHRGWQIASDGKGWRRVVPSPEPRRIVDLAAIRLLTEADAVVIAAGGGGIPVARRMHRLEGIEAVIDKDLTASLLARRLNADMLMILTDVPGVAAEWGTPAQRFIKRISARAVRGMNFASGSMAPKVEACARFAEATGRRAVIGSISDAELLAAGRSGTTVTPQDLSTVFEEPNAKDQRTE